MHRIPASLVALALTLGAVAQEPLADGVTTFLGGGSVVAWFEKGGTVWVTDGTVRGTRDTGVPAGNYSVATDRLIVYRPNRIDRMNADGSTTVLTPPFVFDGFDDDAPAPMVWRWLLNTSSELYIELATWSPTGWSRESRGVQGDPETAGHVTARILRAGRYLVRWDSGGNNSTSLTDLFSSTWRQGFRLWDLDGGGGWGDGVWSGGVLFSAEIFGPSDGFLWAIDRGPIAQLPRSSYLGWGWGIYDYTLTERTPGFPIVERGAQPESVTFLTSSKAVFANPPGTTLEMFWAAPSEQVLALVDQSGSRDVLWLDRTANTWNSTSGFNAPTSIDFVGDFPMSYLAVIDSGGVSLVRYDEATHSATTLVGGLFSLERGLAPLGAGFVLTAGDGVHGSELWFSDGTVSGTRLLSDLRAGSTSTSPRDFVKLGERLVFATDSAAGMQIWSIEPQHLDWRRNPSNGRFYRLTAPASWPIARTEARNAGGELATVRDAGEQAWLNDTFGPGNLWIGLADHQQSGTFTWTSGEPLGFTAWCPNQPDRGAGETVVHITDYPGYCVGGWNDQDPNDRYPGIVERSEPPRPVEEFGIGCSLYPPQPIASAKWAGGWPRPGGAVDLDFTFGTGYFMAAAMFLGVDATSFGTTPLPFELVGLGAPGCFLNVRPDDALIILDPFNQPPSWTIPVSLRFPNLVQLRGATLFVQGIAFERAFPRVRTTNGLRITIGE